MSGLATMTVAQWIGLIGLAGMVFVMVAGFVYLKFVNPHNTDQKDR